MVFDGLRNHTHQHRPWASTWPLACSDRSASTLTMPFGGSHRCRLDQLKRKRFRVRSPFRSRRALGSRVCLLGAGTQPQLLPVFHVSYLLIKSTSIIILISMSSIFILKLEPQISLQVLVFMLQPSDSYVAPSQSPTCPPVMAGATDINSGQISCPRDIDQDLALDHSPGPDIFLDSGGQVAIHVSLFLTILTSLSHLFLQPTSHSASPSLPPLDPVLSL